MGVSPTQRIVPINPIQIKEEKNWIGLNHPFHLVFKIMKLAGDIDLSIEFQH